ncbi:hypothetical protein BN971_00342 [Mycobacterium bohemicum DSM 44277]|uniref:Uncharacterized protein n=2 Tax=Mycobacterium bohemicum TaxID=56425 RepID=A0A1X1RG42_MYCBE|nr:hypothetical protein [Mycobacterium bohemicum]MCV6970146.1 hypothetical protein [Mycobacterium bohemicum]ORV05049.1 hypothetical protein AWB93_00480 [Mycobacterium bohemicum]CPR03778.1 hypothetical protein BN971_00342 [Mycobacterium bohemicum DSM 44277]
MTGAHSDIGPELRRLAQAILDGVDPAVRAAAALTAGAGPGTGKCQQVWCPVCALAALASGEEHPLLTVIADHGVALLDVVRGIVSDINNAGANPPEPPPPPEDGPPGGDGPPAGGQAPTGAGTLYQPIPIVVEE